MRTTAAIAALLSLAAAAPALADSMTVQVDHAARVSLSASAANVFVGNAAIADAVIVDRHNLVVVGKRYGVTHLLVLDGAGRTILNRQVHVSSVDDGQVTLFQGAKGANYACAPTCEQTPLLGQAPASAGGSQSSAGGSPGNP